MMEREVYRDCMRNHAATLGTYATDGCGEYTPDPTTPGGLQCAACGCHRNFHRKVPVVAGEAGDSLVVGYSPLASAEERTSDGKRRVRTKFSAEQKERMLQFSEKIGWRLPRRDGEVDEVGKFCREVGVSRQIFKVWMHNHKNTSTITTATTTSASTATTTNTVAAVAIDASANAGDANV